MCESHAAHPSGGNFTRAEPRFAAGQRVTWKGVAGVVVQEGKGAAAHDEQRLLIRHSDGEAWAWAHELELRLV